MDDRSPRNEDAIDLADLAAVLYRQRWLILGGTVAASLAALVLSWLLPTKYELESYLRVGKLGQEHISKPTAVASQIKSLGRVVGKDHFAGDVAGFDYKAGWSVTAQGGGIVSIQIPETLQAERYKGFVQAVNERIVQQHKQRVKAVESRLQSKIEFLEEDLRRMQKRKAELMGRMEKQITGSPTELEAGQQQVVVLRQLLANVGAEISNIKARLGQLKSEMDALEPTKVVLPPRFSDVPVYPNTQMNLALGLILGLFLSMLWAFTAEFWRNNRARIRGVA